MAVGNSLLPGLARGWTERSECGDVYYDLTYFSGSALPLIYGDAAFQGSDCGMLLSYVHRLGFLWSAYHTVWVSLPGSAADHSPALPSKRDRAALANSHSVLPLGQYSRVLVVGSDCVFNYYCRWFCARKLGTC